MRTFFEIANMDSLVLGVNEGELHEMFGYIADIESDNQSTLFALDSEFNEVRAFDFNGSFLGSFGGQGEGPGEFRFAREIAVTDNIIFVADGWKIHVFERQGTSFAYLRTFNRENFPGFAGNCAMNGYLYTAGFAAGSDQEHVIHKLDPDGTHLASFGEPYRSPNTLIQDILSADGILACNEKHRIISWVRRNVPVVTAYTEDGEMVWRARLDDFKPMIIEEGLSGGQASYSFTGPYPGDSVFHTLFSDDKDHFYLGYYKEGASKNEFANHVFRLDARTGANEYLGEGRVSEVAGGLLFLRESSPFPRVIIFRHAMR